MFNDIKLRALQPQEKEYDVCVGDGLYIRVKPSGKKYWIARMKVDGRSKRRSLGVYPDVSLRKARAKIDDLRNNIKDNASFEVVAREWFETQLQGVVDDDYAGKVLIRIEQHLMPVLGDIPISEITTSKLLVVLKEIEKTGKIDTAHRMSSYCSRIFKYAVATDRIIRDPTVSLIRALKPNKPTHMAALTNINDIKRLLICMCNFDGSFIVQKALWFSAYTFCRPGEIRHAEWNEVDFDNHEWRIPAEKMKMRKTHIVPLATQTMQIIEDMKPLTGHGRYIFPSTRSSKGTVPMSENTILYAIRRMGFGPDEMTAHGFRGMASTRLHELGYPSIIIEHQLSHVDKNLVRSAYNHAEYLDERRKLMQEWADYLDTLAG